MIQETQTIHINKSVIFWNYLATFLQIGSGLILFPFILSLLSTETVAIWSIFLSISSLIGLLDFGFASSFSRNITYIFSGVNQLQIKGISTDSSNEINYDLLSNTIKAMRWFYSRISLISFVVISLLGTFYLYNIVETKFTGDKVDVYVSWVLFCIINTYNIYTLYFDSLLIGKGLVKQDKQIIIVGQIFYLIVSIAFILSGFGLISLVIGRLVSLLIKRQLSYKVFFTKKLKYRLSMCQTHDYKKVLNIIKPNAIKVGLTGLGAFFILQSAVLIGSWYISLGLIASYTITTQIINVVGSLSKVYYSSNIPKIAQLRVKNDYFQIKRIYINSILIMLVTYFGSIAFLALFGNIALDFIGSKTHILSSTMIMIIGLIGLLEENHGIAGGFLLSNNEVPYFKASLISGFATVVLLMIFIKYLGWEIWGMILAPGVVQLVYQNWKWPLQLIKEINKNLR